MLPLCSELRGATLTLHSHLHLESHCYTSQAVPSLFLSPEHTNERGSPSMRTSVQRATRLISFRYSVLFSAFPTQTSFTHAISCCSVASRKVLYFGVHSHPPPPFLPSLPLNRRRNYLSDGGRHSAKLILQVPARMLRQRGAIDAYAKTN